MTGLLWGVALVLSGVAAGLPAASVASAQPDGRGPVEDFGPLFRTPMRAFVRLRQATEASLPAETAKTEADRRAEHQKAFARSLIAARHDAQPGDLFRPAVAARIRVILRDALAGPDGVNIRRTLEEGDAVRLPPLHVNDLYPENTPLVTMPPTLLRRLPALPTALAYCIVGTSLVLKDVDTNVIVDVLADAIPVAR